MSEETKELLNRINKYAKICMDGKSHNIVMNQDEIKTLKRYIENVNKELEATQEVAIGWKRKYEMATLGETTDDIECLLDV